MCSLVYQIDWNHFISVWALLQISWWQTSFWDRGGKLGGSTNWHCLVYDALYFAVHQKIRHNLIIKLLKICAFWDFLPKKNINITFVSGLLHKKKKYCIKKHYLLVKIFYELDLNGSKLHIFLKFNETSVALSSNSKNTIVY